MELSRKKKAVFSLIMFCMIIIITELLLHLCTAIHLFPLHAQLTPDIYHPTNDAEYRLDANGSPIFVNGYKSYISQGIPPQFIPYDADGFRPQDSRRFSQDAIYKIGAFGDSYTEGLQVSDAETFVRLWESSLKAHRPDLAVFNFGVGGTGTYHSYLRYLTVAEKTNLDEVVLFFLPQNDVLNNYSPLGGSYALAHSPYWQDHATRSLLAAADSGNHNAAQSPEPSSLKRSLLRISFIFRAAIFAPKIASGTLIEIFPDIVEGDIYAWLYDAGGERESWLGVYKEPAGDWLNAWNHTEEIILAFQEAAKQNNARFTMVLVADSLQIRDAAGALPASISTTHDFAYPNKHLMSFCAMNHIRCLDSLPHFAHVLKEKQLEEPYFSWKYDGHYAAIGHETMAAFLQEHFHLNHE